MPDKTQAVSFPGISDTRHLAVQMIQDTYITTTTSIRSTSSAGKVVWHFLRYMFICVTSKELSRGIYNSFSSYANAYHSSCPSHICPLKLRCTTPDPTVLYASSNDCYSRQGRQRLAIHPSLCWCSSVSSDAKHCVRRKLAFWRALIQLTEATPRGLLVTDSGKLVSGIS